MSSPTVFFKNIDSKFSESIVNKVPLGTFDEGVKPPIRVNAHSIFWYLASGFDSMLHKWPFIQMHVFEKYIQKLFGFSNIHFVAKYQKKSSGPCGDIKKVLQWWKIQNVTL